MAMETATVTAAWKAAMAQATATAPAAWKAATGQATATAPAAWKAAAGKLHALGWLLAPGKLLLEHRAKAAPCRYPLQIVQFKAGPDSDAFGPRPIP